MDRKHDAGGAFRYSTGNYIMAAKWFGSHLIEQWW